jgi:hypothetical protein
MELTLCPASLASPPSSVHNRYHPLLPCLLACSHGWSSRFGGSAVFRLPCDFGCKRNIGRFNLRECQKTAGNRKGNIDVQICAYKHTIVKHTHIHTHIFTRPHTYTHSTYAAAQWREKSRKEGTPSKKRGIGLKQGKSVRAYMKAMWVPCVAAADGACCS